MAHNEPGWWARACAPFNWPYRARGLLFHRFSSPSNGRRFHGLSSVNFLPALFPAGRKRHQPTPDGFMHAHRSMVLIRVTRLDVHFSFFLSFFSNVLSVFLRTCVTRVTRLRDVLFIYFFDYRINEEFAPFLFRAKTSASPRFDTG